MGKLSGTALSEKGQSAVWCCSCCPRVVRDIAGAGPVLSKILQVLYPGVRDIAGAVPALSAIWQALSHIVRDMAGAMPALSGIWQALSLRCPRYGRRCPRIVRDMAGAVPALSGIWQALSPRCQGQELNSLTCGYFNWLQTCLSLSPACHSANFLMALNEKEMVGNSYHDTTVHICNFNWMLRFLESSFNVNF